jgi:predicted lipoprotein with Yx(FWY)xxD motif
MLVRTLTTILTIPLIASACGGMDEPVGEPALSASATTSVAAPESTAPAVSAAAPPETAAPEPAAETTPAESAPTRHPTLKVVKSEFGTTIADDHGEALYLFDADTATKSACYDACAVAWPPVLVKKAPTVSGALKADLVSTTKRRDGTRQVTYNGHPLYYYVGDAPGVIKCQNVFEYGGKWLIVKPNGKANPAG